MPAEISLVLRLRMIFQACGTKLAMEAMAARYPRITMAFICSARIEGWNLSQRRNHNASASQALRCPGTIASLGTSYLRHYPQWPPETGAGRIHSRTTGRIMIKAVG